MNSISVVDIYHKSTGIIHIHTITQPLIQYCTIPLDEPGRLDDSQISIRKKKPINSFTQKMPGISQKKKLEKLCLRVKYLQNEKLKKKLFYLVFSVFISIAIKLNTEICQNQCLLNSSLWNIIFFLFFRLFCTQFQYNFIFRSNCSIFFCFFFFFNSINAG